MRLYYVICLFLITTLSFSQVDKLRVFKQQVNTAGFNVLMNKDEWVFIKEVYSNSEMIQDKQILTDSITIDSIFKEHSFSKKFKYKYFICKLYIFKENFGLINKEFFITKKEFISNYKIPDFKTFNFSIDFESSFNCVTEDVVYENIVCVYNLGNGISKAVIEYDQSSFYTSIFNNECDLIERIKINKDDLNFLMYKKSFFLKSEDYLIVYSEGNANNIPWR